MMAQIWAKGFQEHIVRRLLCLSVFWHALDIIWVAIFTIVYLIGTIAMTDDENDLLDVAPGLPHSNILSETLSYVLGLALA